jgi:sulfur carrier protein
MNAPDMRAAPVNVQVNGAPHVTRAGATLADLLAAMGEAPEQCATAVNEAFVARALRATHLLREGDRITCFKPIVGG